MSVNWPALHTEIGLPEYSGLNDADAAAHYNAKTASVYTPISITALRIWAASTGFRAMIEAAAGDPTNAYHSQALTLRDVLQDSSGPPLDIHEPTIAAMLTAEESGSFLTTDQATALVAIAMMTAPLYSQPGGFGLAATVADIHAVRN